MTEGAQPDREMCEHCSSWSEGSGYPCHECGAMWPEGGKPCEACGFIFATAANNCERCDRVRDPKKVLAYFETWWRRPEFVEVNGQGYALNQAGCYEPTDKPKPAGNPTRDFPEVLRR